MELTNEQRTIEWYKARLGFFTGSKVGALMGLPKAKSEVFTDTAKTYIYQVAAQRLLNDSVLNDDETFQNYLNLHNTYDTKPIKWGKEQETNAKVLFQNLFPNIALTETGFVQHEDIEYFGASPDGLLYDYENKELGILEIKCPLSNTYIKYIANIDNNDLATSLKKLNSDYYWQLIAEMAVTNTEFAMFMLYCPWLKTPFKIYKLRRNEDVTDCLTERVLLANDYIKTITF
jgi:putative phage-type endonuclease